MSATNGQTSHGNPTPDDLDSQLQTARKRLELAQVTRRLELLERHKTKRQHLKENAEGWDTFLSGYSDLIDRFRGPDRDLIFPVSTAYDRRYGCNWPFWRTWQDHARIRASSRVVTGTSGLAYGVLSGLTSYIVCDGMLAGATAAHDSVDPALVAAIQQLCDTFYESQEFAAIQQELVFRDRRDGEFFLRLFAKDDGNTVIRTVEPEQIVEPPNKSMDEASFGIFVDPEDLQDVRGYWVAYDGDSGNGEYVPGEEMIHSKANVDRIIKRGAPDYMFDTLDLIKTASRLIENIGQGAAIQAAIAFVRQHAAADATAIADYVEGLASYDVREPFNGSTQPLQRFDPGTIIDIDSGQEFVATPFGANVQGFQAAVQVLLRALAVKWNAPEWITSADSSNNNFSSSLVAESPFVRSVKRFQKHYATCFLRVVRYAVRHWIRKRGKITVKGKSYDWNAIEKLVKIAVTPPTAEVRDRNQEAQRDKNYLDMGVKSRQLIAEEQGIDYERVERDNEEYEKAHPQQGPGGGDQGGSPLADAFGGLDKQAGDGQDNQGDQGDGNGNTSFPDEQPASSGLSELLTESASSVSTSDMGSITGQRLREEDGEPDLEASEALANLHAAVLNALAAAGDDVEGYAATADDELDGSGWNLARSRQGGWHAVRDTEEVQESRQYSPSLTELLEAGGERAPAGGISLSGRFYKGGMFIPGKEIAKASPEDKAKLEKAKADSETKAKAKSAERKAKPVDRASLADRLSKATGGRKLLPSQEKSARASWRMLQRFHGDEALHRVQEIADAAEAALGKLDKSHPAAVRLRQRLGELAWMAGQEEAPAEKVADEAKATPPAVESPPPDTVPVEGGKRKARDGSMWKQAAAGGEVSPVNGQFYKGGHWMPIHGLSEKRPKTEKTGKGDAPPATDEEGKGRGSKGGPRAEMTPDEIEAMKHRKRIEAIKSGPLESLVGINAGTGKPFRENPGWKNWQEFAASAGDARLRQIADALKPTEGDAALDYEDELKHPQGFAAGAPKKHHREYPASAEAYAALSTALRHAKTVDDVERVSDVLTGKVTPAPTAQPQSSESPAPAAPDAGAKPADQPAKQELATDIPSHIRDQLARSLHPLERHREGLEQGRVADAKFQGNGRYEWDAFVNGKVADAREPETVRKFRDMAKQNGVDADAVLKEMGYAMPELSEKGKVYGRDEIARRDRNGSPVSDGERKATGFTGKDSQGRQWANGELVAKQEQPQATKQAAPSEADAEAAFADAYERAASKVDQGYMPNIPDLYDDIKGKVPGLTEPEFHRLLQKWHDEEKIQLQQGDAQFDKEKFKRGMQGRGDRGTLLYVDKRKGFGKPAEAAPGKPSTPDAPQAATNPADTPGTVEPKAADPFAIRRVEGEARWDRPAVTYHVGDKEFSSRKDAEAHVAHHKRTAEDARAEAAKSREYVKSINDDWRKRQDSVFSAQANDIANHADRLERLAAAAESASPENLVKIRAAVDGMMKRGAPGAGSPTDKQDEETVNSLAPKSSADTPGTVEHFKATVLDPMQRSQGGKPLYSQQVERLAARYNARHGTSLDVARKTPAAPTPDEVQAVHKATQGRTLRPGELDAARDNLHNKVDSKGGGGYAAGGDQKPPAGETKMSQPEVPPGGQPPAPVHGRTPRPAGKPGNFVRSGKGAARVGEVFRGKDGQRYVVTKASSRRVSDDEIEDQDAWHTYQGGPGHYTHFTAVPVEDTEVEKVADAAAAAERQKVADAAASKKAGEDAAWSAVSGPTHKAVSERPAEIPADLQWEPVSSDTGGNKFGHGTRRYVATLPDGTRVGRSVSTGADDYRESYFVPTDMAHAKMLRHAEEVGWDEDWASDPEKTKYQPKDYVEAIKSASPQMKERLKAAAEATRQFHAAKARHKELMAKLQTLPIDSPEYDEAEREANDIAARYTGKGNSYRKIYHFATPRQMSRVKEFEAALSKHGVNRNYSENTREENDELNRLADEYKRTGDRAHLDAALAIAERVKARRPDEDTPDGDDAEHYVTGNTYPHRDAIKRLGGRWDARNKRWIIPAGIADKLPRGLSSEAM